MVFYQNSKYDKTYQNDTRTNKMNMTDNNPINNLKHLIISSRERVVLSVNTTMVQTYWNIGKTLVQDEQRGNARATYGKKQLEVISQVLTKEFGKGFDASNLRNMRRFFIAFPIRETVSPKLSWSHYCKLIKIENTTARQWYIDEAIDNNWSARALDRQIGKLTHQDVGQMDTYVRIYDKFHKTDDDNPTVGLILCSEHSKAVAKYSVLNDNDQLFSSKYLPFLPTVEELQIELQRERELLDDGITT